MQSGHLSDPGVYKTGDLNSRFTSPVFHRSSSGSKLEMSQSYNYENGGRSPDNHSTQLPLSNSQSFEDLQRLVGVQGGIQGNQEYCVEFVPICFQSVQVLQEFDSKIQILYLLSV